MTDPQDLHTIRYKNTAGVVLRGTLPVASTIAELGLDTSKHITRTALLSAQLEAPKWGTIQTYDGCGISGGILHHTATFPGKQTQGSLWPLLRAIEIAEGRAILPEVLINAKGVATRTDTTPLSGDDIRALFTGLKSGLTPSPSPSAEVSRRIMAVHDALKRKSSWPHQVRAAEDWLYDVTGKWDFSGLLVKDRPADQSDFQHVRAPVFASATAELAMCVVRSFAVNSPAAALRAFKGAGTPVPTLQWVSRLYRRLRDEKAQWDTRMKNARDGAALLGFWDNVAMAPLKSAAN